MVREKSSSIVDGFAVEPIHARLAYKTLAVTCQTFSDWSVFVTRCTGAEMDS